MLVLSRGVRQSIKIGHNGEITVVVLEIRKGKNGDLVVKLGIQAPEVVAVHRGEVQQRIKAGIPFVRRRQHAASAVESAEEENTAAASDPATEDEAQDRGRFTAIHYLRIPAPPEPNIQDQAP